MAKKDKAAGAAEEIVFSVVEQQSYDAAWKLLNQPSTTFFAPFPSVVNTDEIKFPSNKKIQVTTKVKATSVSNHGTTMTDTATSTATASSTSVASLPSTSSSNVGAVGLVDGMHPTMSPTANFPSMMRTTVTGTEATDSAIFGVEDIYAPPVPTREPTIAATLFDPGFGMMMNDDDATTTTTTAIAFEAHDQLLRPAMNASTNGHQYPTQRSSVRRQGAMQHQQVLPSIMRVDDTANVSLATLGRGQQELETALKQLEHIEKDSEVGLLHKCDLTRQLTELVTGASYVSATDAIQHLELLGKTVPRRVCQHPFRKNDIVWVCRTCQADETCVLCHACFSQSNHDGHDVAFYHAQAGGCCDCGDPDGMYIDSLSIFYFDASVV
jgi:Putative zinc finger in N-recognin (UBR box)